MQKGLTEMKILLKVLGGGLLFFKHPVYLENDRDIRHSYTYIAYCHCKYIGL